MFDLIVVGLGCMGSAAALQATRRGLRAAAFDRFRSPHRLGSSHGQSRVFRFAYGSHPSYHKLMEQSLTLWKEIEEESHADLLRTTGVLLVGDPEADLVREALEVAQHRDIPHEIWSSAEIQDQAPALHLPQGVVGYWEPDAGVLLPETAIASQLELASDRGAEIHPDEQVFSWTVEDNHVEIETAVGRYRSQRLLLTAGPWLSGLLGDVDPPLEVQRKCLFWFEPKTHTRYFTPGEFLPFYLQTEEGEVMYGIPELGQGVKFGSHSGGSQVASVEEMKREVTFAEVQKMRSLLDRFLPHAAGLLRKTTVCLYTNTPDRHFLIDRHPRSDRVWFVSACSGQGFRFAPAITAEVTKRIAGQSGEIDLHPFHLTRFQD